MGKSSDAIILELEELIKETQRVYPWVHIILIGLSPVGSSYRRSSIHRVNAFMQHISANERMVSYASNNNAKLRDNIHLARSSKVKLANAIHTIITKPYLKVLQKF